MSPREEYHTVRLPKGWTPAKIIEFAKVVDLLGRLGRLGIENAALRRERRALRKALRRLRDVAVAVSENADCGREGPGTCADLDGDTFKMCDPCWLRHAVSRAAEALKLRKARRRKA